jgi:hypothetical protein
MGCGTSKQSDAVLAQTPADLLVETIDIKADEEVVDDKVKFLEAIKENDLVKVQECLRSNASLVNAATSDGWTGLHYCATKGFDKIANYLIENHADMNSKKKDGNTALHNAAMNNNVNMIHLLVKFGAKIDETNLKKQSALQVAFEYSHIEAIGVLESYEKTVHEKFLSAIDDNIRSIKFNDSVAANDAVAIESVSVAPINDDTVIQDEDSLVSPTDDTTIVNTAASNNDDSMNWIEKFSVKYNRKFWKHAINNTTTWNDPFKPVCTNPDYDVVYSASYGRYYYKHKITKEKTWNDPSQNDSVSTKLDATEISNTEGEADLQQPVDEENISESPSNHSTISNENENIVHQSHRKPAPPPLEEEATEKVATEVSPGDTMDINTKDSTTAPVTHRKPPPPPSAAIDPVVQESVVEEATEKVDNDVISGDAIDANTKDIATASVGHRRPPPPPTTTDLEVQEPVVEEAIENVDTDASLVPSQNVSDAVDIPASESTSKQANRSKRRPPSKMRFKTDDDTKDSNSNDATAVQSTSEKSGIIKSDTNTESDKEIPNKVVVPLSKKEQDKLIAEQAMAAMRKKREEKEKQNKKSEE